VRKDEFQSLIERVSALLGAEAFDVVEFDNDVALVEIVSSSFEDMRLKERFELVWRATELADPDVWFQVLPTFLLRTPSEWAKYPLRGASREAGD
jgi:hypothetical protein